MTGFRHFWFLPAMAVTIPVLWFHDNAGPRPAAALVGALALWHLAAGEFDSGAFQYLPWGTAIVGFLFVPGAVVRYLHADFAPRPTRIRAGADLTIFSAWFVLAWVVLHNRLFMPLADDPYQLVSGLDEPWRLLFQDMFLLLSFFTVLRLG